jgi:hypothetical protein
MWSVLLLGKTLKLFESEVLRKVCRSKMGEVSGHFNNKELHDLCGPYSEI